MWLKQTPKRKQNIFTNHFLVIKYTENEMLQMLPDLLNLSDTLML